MKIAQVSPLIESVPPRLYGGTERIVSYLTEELVRLGHEVTLFASGDSRTSARLVPCCKGALRLDGRVEDTTPYTLSMIDRLRRRARQFDVLHFHIDQLHCPVFRDSSVPTLTTLHGRQDLPDLAHLYRSFPEMPLISISRSQQRPIAWANIRGTVMHGLPTDLHAPCYAPRGGYLAFLGRVSPEKGLDKAIAIAQAAGLPLRIAAKIDHADTAYYHGSIEPLLADPGIEFVGEIDEMSKTDFLSNASALLFPIAWPEPFGLVMIEAMACGTPVLAFRCGSVPEVIEDGRTGYIVNSVAEAIARLPDVLALDRRAVRRRFDERFTARRMTLDYIAHYRALAKNARQGSGNGTTRTLANGYAIGTR